METKHTKGEWNLSRGLIKLSDTRINTEIGKCQFIDSKFANTKPALVFGDNDEQIIANAKLIAAAPELLEALIKMNDYFFCEKPLEEEEYSDLIKITQRAIEKATK